jgi:hypothetical protein
VSPCLEVAEAMGAEAAARCAVQVLAPGRKGMARVALERVVGPDIHCLPLHPPHRRPSFRELNGIT